MSPPRAIRTGASLSSPVAIFGVAAGTAISTLAGTCQRAAGDGCCEGESLSSDLCKFRLGVMFFDFVVYYSTYIVQVNITFSLIIYLFSSGWKLS